MITDVMHAIGAFFVVVGALFCVIGGIGVVRLPDFYSRCHGSGVTDSAGAGALLLGLMFFAPPLVAFKLLALVAFLWVSSAVSTHSLAKAAHSQGVRIENVPRIDWTIAPPPPPESQGQDEGGEGVEGAVAEEPTGEPVANAGGDENAVPPEGAEEPS